MSSWLDRWARRAAEATPSTAQDALEPLRSDAGSARRDFLKKAGIVGGVAWSVPVLQTVMAPAASASNGTLLGNNCPAGNVACAGGTAFCATTAPFRCGGLGATCGACASGAGTCSNATCGGGGGTCTPANQATTCVSGICVGTTCRALVGAACSTGADCANSRPCSSGPNGASLTCGGPGATCTGGTQALANAQCTYNNCSSLNGTCGGSGAVCNQPGQGDISCNSSQGNPCRTSGANAGECK